MLTYEDEPTIRHALMKRLEKERGVKICQILIHEHEDCIAVGILATLDDGFDRGIVTRSRFELPRQFALSHLHNEIDEIAEQFKAARRDHMGRSIAGVILDPETQLSGTGLRGRWPE